MKQRLSIMVAAALVLSGCSAAITTGDQIRSTPCGVTLSLDGVSQPAERLTPEQCEQKRANLEAMARAAAQRAAQEAQQKRDDAIVAKQKRDAIVAQAIRDEKARGYQRISLETFLLDGKDLAARAAKVSLQGAYLQEGNIGMFFTNQVAIMKVTQAPQIGRNEPRVPLLTDDATRESRQYLLRCRSNPAAAQVGCPITILGHATMCTATGPLGVGQELPCVAVDEARP
jgi:hypothetical protein